MTDASKLKQLPPLSLSFGPAATPVDPELKFFSELDLGDAMAEIAVAPMKMKR